MRLSIKVKLSFAIDTAAAFRSRPLLAQHAAASPSAKDNGALVEKGRLVVANVCLAGHT